MNSQRLRQTASVAMLADARRAQVALQAQKQRTSSFGGTVVQDSAHHRCYRSGRLVPGGVLTGAGLRGTRYKEAGVPLQYRTRRPHLSRPAYTERHFTLHYGDLTDASNLTG